MKKKAITLTQNVVSLADCLEMAKKGILPLVITLTQQEAERIDTIRKMQEINNKNISEDLSSIEAISRLYYGYSPNQENGRYMDINSNELRKLIESDKIYISKFIDSYYNTKYVDYIYPSDGVESTGGIVFRNKPRLFGKDKDYYKLIKENVHMSIGGRSGIVTLFSSIPYDADCKEFCDLSFETIEAYEDYQKK